MSLGCFNAFIVEFAADIDSFNKMMTTPTLIPQIDMSLDDDTVAAELHAALTTTGFAILLNHGLDKSLRKNTFAASKAFFLMSTEEKMKSGYQGHKSNRGYIACGKEKHDDSNAADFKETYDINPDGDAASGYSQPWPPDKNSGPLSAFQTTMVEYFDQMNRLHLSILRLVAIGLKMPPRFLVDRCNERHSNLRLLHYPEIPTMERPKEKSDIRQPVVRGNVHTDFGTITLLTQDNVGGLRVKCLDGSWVFVPPVSNSLVVNVGDMLQRWTNDVLKANPHQVVDVTESDDGVIPERFSVAFFCNANKETMLECLPQCVSEARPARYEPVKAFDYITMRLSQTVDDSFDS